MGCSVQHIHQPDPLHVPTRRLAASEADPPAKPAVKRWSATKAISQESRGRGACLRSRLSSTADAWSSSLATSRPVTTELERQVKAASRTVYDTTDYRGLLQQEPVSVLLDVRLKVRDHVEVVWLMNMQMGPLQEGRSNWQLARGRAHVWH